MFLQRPKGTRFSHPQLRFGQIVPIYHLRTPVLRHQSSKISHPCRRQTISHQRRSRVRRTLLRGPLLTLTPHSQVNCFHRRSR